MEKIITLDTIKPGEAAVICSLNSTGSMRRRLLDLGLSAGTSVECVGRSPSGDPISLLIRGAVIAIRLSDAKNITVKISEISEEKVIALAGNPNVGKSTVFNGLTGMHQHTGNWAGKTVSNACGRCKTEKNSYLIVDIPGTYSLMAHSAEEEVARNFVCFGNPDAVVVVCDATCLERNLNLALQTMEICPNVVLCVNLMDEAKKKNIEIDCEKLSSLLNVPVVATVARKHKNLTDLMGALDQVTSVSNKTMSPSKNTFKVPYCKEIEDALKIITPILDPLINSTKNQRLCHLPVRWVALRLLEEDQSLMKEIENCLGSEILENKELICATEIARSLLKSRGYSKEKIKDEIVSTLIKTAENISNDSVKSKGKTYKDRDQKIDRVLTSRPWAYPAMVLLLALVFWITITGANYPSRFLSQCLFALQEKITDFFICINAPAWLYGSLVLGAYRVLAWVVSVMLPPMAIFFPLFTILEDSGYLPRIAYNLDKPFQKCCACGKQALTMCMGFGCNAVGITGCRIIDSPRERILAILTNAFVPCNGRFPALISVITMFFIVADSQGYTNSLLSALLLTGVILLGIGATFLVTKILSATLLKGIPSSFTLELPPYRCPQFGKVIVRSILDRTLFVLGRAVCVAAPAGLIIWIFANTSLCGDSILNHLVDFFQIPGSIMGLDGAILVAFILGLPANEIVLPIIIMIYSSQGYLMEMESTLAIRELFINNGWTATTALCFMVFCLMHWPCSTSLLTIKKETGSWKWTALAAAIPTIVGFTICVIINLISKMLL